MYGITDNDPYDVMDIVKLVPQMKSVSSAFAEPPEFGGAYPLNARVQAVVDHLNRMEELKCASGPWKSSTPTKHYVVDKNQDALPKDLPLITALARSNNTLYYTNKLPADAKLDSAIDAVGLNGDGASEVHDLPKDPDVPSTDPDLVFERIHPSVLDGVPLDLHREVTERLAKYFPHLRFDLRDMSGKELSEHHTNRYYVTSSPEKEGNDRAPFFMLVPREFRTKTIDIDLAQGMTLSLDSEHYSFSPDDRLVISEKVFDELRMFIPNSGTITSEMMEPFVKLIPASLQRRAASLRGQQLVDLLAVELRLRTDGTNALYRALTRWSDERARNNAQAPAAGIRPPRLEVRARLAVFHSIAAAIRVANILRRAIVRGFLWFYRNNIASILIYTVGATAVTNVLGSPTNMVKLILVLLWVYTFVVVGSVLLRLRTGSSVVEKVVLVAYPEVYPMGSTPTDIVPLVPKDALAAAIEQAARDAPVDFEAIVQRMVIKPSWFRALAVIVGSLEPVTYKEWVRQVRLRRSMAFDAVRQAVTSQQQIGADPQ